MLSTTLILADVWRICSHIETYNNAAKQLLKAYLHGHEDGSDKRKLATSLEGQYIKPAVMLRKRVLAISSEQASKTLLSSSCHLLQGL